MVPPELSIRAQDRKDGLFQNIVAEIEQCEKDEISHIPMMIQKEEVCQFSFFICTTICCGVGGPTVRKHGAGCRAQEDR